MPWEGLDNWRSNTFQNTLAPNTQTHFHEILSGRKITGNTLGSISDPTHQDQSEQPQSPTLFSFRNAVTTPAFPPPKLSSYPNLSRSRQEERNACLNLTKHFTKSEKVLSEKDNTSK